MIDEMKFLEELRKAHGQEFREDCEVCQLIEDRKRKLRESENK
jgi:hypothetical protein